MIDVLRIAHLRIAPQEGNLEVGNCEGNRIYTSAQNSNPKVLSDTENVWMLGIKFVPLSPTLPV